MIISIYSWRLIDSQFAVITSSIAQITQYGNAKDNQSIIYRCDKLVTLSGNR